MSDPRTRYRAKCQALLAEYKDHASCVICGARPGDPRELHLHHLDPSTKLGPVSRHASNANSPRRILIELEKCVPVCETCHMRIHGLGDPIGLRQPGRLVTLELVAEGVGEW